MTIQIKFDGIINSSNTYVISCHNNVKKNERPPKADKNLLHKKLMMTPHATLAATLSTRYTSLRRSLKMILADSLHEPLVEKSAWTC